MRYLLVILSLVHGTAFANGSSSAAWFAANWFKQNEKVEKVVDSDDNVVTPVGMDEYIKSCTELTNDKYFCKKNWLDAAFSGQEIILIPADRTLQVKKSTKPEVKKVAKAEVKVVKYKTESKVKGVNLLDVSNEEYKKRRDAALAKPNAVVIHETYR